jgi:TOTE conflict system, Archaeo-Eukaryotic Primase domain
VDDQELAGKFHQLFRGLDRSHGEYTVPKGAKPSAVDGKLEGSAVTLSEPVTVELWCRHLAGEIGLGITPVNESGFCRWGCIDIDVYPLDLNDLNRRIQKFKLPLLIARTKSGGAHLLLFLTDIGNAADVRDILTRWARKLGYPKAEVFPKQDMVEGKGFGSWLNMPYQAGKRSTRYVLDPATGESLTPEEFLDVAYDRSAPPDNLESWEPVGDTPSVTNRGPSENDVFPEGPPCLNLLWAEGVPAHTHNEVMFNIALYYKRVDSVTAEARSLAMSSSVRPNKDMSEIRATVRGALKRQYQYRCRNQPLVTVCQRDECIKRRFGIGEQSPITGDGAPLVLGALYKILTDPPIWAWDINGRRVELTSDQMLNQRQFAVRVHEATSILPKPLRPSAWTALIAKRSLEAPQHEVPPDATQAGVVWHALEKYCTNRARGQEKSELLMEKPVSFGGRTYFVGPAFLAWCHAQRVVVTERKLYGWLHDRGMEHSMMEVQGKTVSVWSVPDFEEQVEPFDVPRDSEVGERF